MALYDQNQMNGAPWNAYATQSQTPNYISNQKQTAVPTSINQFVWVQNEGTVDMWPMVAGSEMTFIDNDKMLLYVKRVDQYNHPLKIRKFKLVEINDEPEATNPTQAPSVNMDELKAYMTSEIDRAVNNRLASMFQQPTVKGDGTNA